MTKRWKSRRALALPLAIGVLSWCGARLAIAPMGDAIAAKLARAVPKPPSPAPSPEPDPPPTQLGAPIPDPTDEELEAVGVVVPAPRRVASRSPTSHRATAGEEPVATNGADALPLAVAAPVDDAPKATIFVPATLVSRALERRDVGATNARAPDGSALGARLLGVTKYRTGLRDGDVVVSVGATRTPNVSAMVSAAMQSASAGAPRISGRIMRGDAVFAVVLEVPR
jgi:hypothetical protein